MRTIRLEPNVPGLVRWLRVVFLTDPERAAAIMAAGWPTLSPTAIVDVLTDCQTLEQALADAGPNEWGIAPRPGIVKGAN